MIRAADTDAKVVNVERRGIERWLKAHAPQSMDFYDYVLTTFARTYDALVTDRQREGNESRKFTEEEAARMEAAMDWLVGLMDDSVNASMHFNLSLDGLDGGTDGRDPRIAALAQGKGPG